MKVHSRSAARFGAAEQTAIRARLQDYRSELVTRYSAVERDLQRRNSELPLDAPDRAAQLANDEALSEIDETTRQDIKAIDAALERLDTDRYGYCDRCNQPIAAARLQALPHALTCVECADAQ